MEPKLTPSAFTLDDIEMAGRKTLFMGRGRVEQLDFRHRRYDGGWSAQIRRELYVTGEAVHVALWDPALDAVLLVEQCRPAGLIWNQASWLVECIAGIMDPGETPMETARREVREEAGCIVEHFAEAGLVYASPGSTGDRAHLLCATADLTGAGGQIHGVASENEHIRTLVVAVEKALEAADAGRIADAKTLGLLYWLGRNRRKLAVKS